ncbi:MAG: alkaline phosphatase [Phycisphaerales bacterium]
MSQIPRRRFVQAAGAAIATGALGQGVHASIRRGNPGRLIRNVIFLVSDGMSTGTLTLAEDVHKARTGQSTNWVKLFSEPSARRAVCRTEAADSAVTDSAAAGSAWGIGKKVNNGVINITPDGAEHEPILVTARNAGLATGLVTTTRVTHATPAAFVANVPARNLENGIAEQMIERHVDVILGGGAKHFPDALLAPHDDIHVVRNRNDLLGASADARGRLLGLFAESHVPYALDREASVPSLAEMTRVGLDRLSRRGGFVLQVEGGRVDHAAHANDAGALVADQLDFDEAIGVAINFAREHRDTLVIVTTDHGNANPGLTLYGQAGNDGLARLGHAKRSFEWLMERLGSDDAWRTSPRRLRELIAEMTGGIELPDADLEWLEQGLVRRERVDGFWPRSRDPNCVLGSVLANYYGVSFLSPNHTSDLVEVTAIGPGSELIAPMIDNTDLHELLRLAVSQSARTSG